MKKLLSLLLSLVAITVSAVAETANKEIPAMADGMRSDGKIWVVIAVVVTILGGLVAYLVSVDKKVSRLEDEVESLKG